MKLTEKEILTILQDAHSVPLGSPMWESGEEYNKLVKIIYSAISYKSDKAEQLYDDLCDAWQSDMEHGVKCLNEKAVDDFKNNYPELNVMISRVMSFLWEIVDEDIDE